MLFSHFFQQISWLLTDEIVSALRFITPVSLDTLNLVAEHIKSSDNQRMRFAENVPLDFVYGAESSLQPFIEVRGGFYFAA